MVNCRNLSGTSFKKFINKIIWQCTNRNDLQQWNSVFSRSWASGLLCLFYMTNDKLYCTCVMNYNDEAKFSQEAELQVFYTCFTWQMAKLHGACVMTYKQWNSVFVRSWASSVLCLFYMTNDKLYCTCVMTYHNGIQFYQVYALKVSCGCLMWQMLSYMHMNNIEEFKIIISLWKQVVSLIRI